MKFAEERNTVIQAGKRLAAAGLIQRTWGNVSCRVSQEQFVITPSGRSYLDLTPDEIVAVTLPDLTYEGSVLPSSEMRIHGAVYQMRPEANFIIHTHQEQASIVSALGVASIPVPQEPVPIFGRCIPCADYALPGTETLCRNVAEALTHTEGRAVIMRHHGAVCFGKTYEEAFQTAALLENLCASWLDSTFGNVPQRPQQQENDLCEDPALTDTTVTEAALRRLIFQNHPEARAVCRTIDPAVLFAIQQGGVASWLDDFAQMIGSSLSVTQLLTPFQMQEDRSAALISGFGGLCWGSTEADAQAAKHLLEKNCRAFCYATLCRAKLSVSALPISEDEAVYMRQNYLSNYSKRLKKRT